MKVQQRPWTATLAPVGVLSPAGRIIVPDCVVTVRTRHNQIGVPLMDSALQSEIVGIVTDADIVDGYLVASGVVAADVDLSEARPTFDVHQARSVLVETETTFAYRAIQLASVRIGSSPAWDDPAIRFVAGSTE